MSSGIGYSDSLLSITDEAILFKGYGFLGGNRLVPFTDIEKVVIKRPTVWNGKWRWQGTGGFKTWFPQDFNRQKRDIIFVAHLRKGWWRIGFTAEDSAQVASILREKGLLDKASDMSLLQTAEPSGQVKKMHYTANHTARNIFLAVILVNAVVIPLIVLGLYLAGII
jgi:hypothetical protein